MKSKLLTILSIISFNLIISQGSNPTYTVQSIHYTNYNYENYANTLDLLLDDKYSNTIDLLFDFNFFGNTYSEVVVGSNSSICFDTTLADEFDPWQIDNPIPNPALDKPALLGVKQDLNIVDGGTYKYDNSGYAPFRKYTVIIDSVHLFSCNNMTQSNQMVLWETYNYLDVYVKHREACTTWNNGNAIIGIQNADASEAYAAPGRNSGSWSADNEAYRFKYQKTAPDFQYILCDANNGFDLNVPYQNLATNPSNNYSFHLTYEDATANINPIALGNYSNISNPQFIYLRESDTNNNLTIHPVLLAVINCSTDYDDDGVTTSTEDLDQDGNFGNDDTDGDGIPNFLDDDDDSDGILTIDEDINGDGNPANDDTNNDGIPNYLDNSTVLNIDSIDIFDIIIYPNPAFNFIYIESDKIIGGTIIISDLTGKELYRVKKDDINQKIDVSNLKKGLYFIEIYDNEQRIKVVKFIKE